MLHKRNCMRTQTLKMKWNIGNASYHYPFDHFAQGLACRNLVRPTYTHAYMNTLEYNTALHTRTY